MGAEDEPIRDLADWKRRQAKHERQTTEGILKEFEAQAESIGAQLVLLSVPRRLSRTEFEDTLPEDMAVAPLVYDPIQDFSRYSGEMLYWEHSAGHFTPLGNRIVGEGLAAQYTGGCPGQ